MADTADRPGPSVGGPDSAGASADDPAGPTEWTTGPGPVVGVGPWADERPGRPSDDPRLDPELVESGDRRNVVDEYRYWSREAIVADLDTRRHGFHVAIENWAHDANIGTVVRTANAFLAQEVHIVGRRRWNRRGAMVTDRYLHVHHHPDAAHLADWLAAHDVVPIGVDNLPGAVALESVRLPQQVCLVFGSEGAGLSPDLVAVCERLVAITQYGSTRSINAGAAAAIAMYHWARDWAGPAA